MVTSAFRPAAVIGRHRGPRLSMPRPIRGRLAAAATLRPAKRAGPAPWCSVPASHRHRTAPVDQSRAACRRPAALLIATCPDRPRCRSPSSARKMVRRLLTDRFTSCKRTARLAQAGCNTLVFTLGSSVRSSAADLRVAVGAAGKSWRRAPSPARPARRGSVTDVWSRNRCCEADRISHDPMPAGSSRLVPVGIVIR